MTRILLALAAPALFLIAPPVVAAQTPAPDAAALAPVKPIVEPIPDVVARVNGQSISKADLDGAVTQLQQRVGQPMPADQRDRIVRSVLDQLIAYQLLKQESVSRQVAVPDVDIDTRIQEIKAQFNSEEVFLKALSEQQLTLDLLRTNIREEMRIDRLVDTEVNSRSTVTPAQIEAFYAENPVHFQRAERVKASHILIRVEPEADARTKEQARTKIADLLKQARGGGDFAALAREHSDDAGSGANGGDLGYFERGQMVGPFEDAAFALTTAGQTTEIVETQYGFHIIKLEDRQAAGAVPFSEVRPQIEEYLLNRNREEHTRTFIDGLRAKGKVEIFI